MPTPVLDHQSTNVLAIARQAQSAGRGVDLLRAAHRLIAARIEPIYALQELQPASVTIGRECGSCSQRLAVLEAVARASNIRTRTHGLIIDGRFWQQRFPCASALIPRGVVLAWPEFDLDGTWLSASHLFGTTADPAPFTNSTSETLFEAVGRSAVQWTPGEAAACATTSCDLSGHVLDDLGYFDSRDDLFAQHGQTFNAATRAVLDPVMRRWPVPA